MIARNVSEFNVISKNIIFGTKSTTMTGSQRAYNDRIDHHSGSADYNSSWSYNKNTGEMRLNSNTSGSFDVNLSSNSYNVVAHMYSADKYEYAGTGTEFNIRELFPEINICWSRKKYWYKICIFYMQSSQWI